MSLTLTTPRHSRAIRTITASVFVMALAAACAPASEDNSTGGAAATSIPAAVRGPNTGSQSPAAGTFITPGERMRIGGCQTFPTNNAFHADITRLPVAANSAATIQAAGADLLVSPPYSTVWQGSRPGQPINVVDSRNVPKVNFLGGQYAYISDLLDHPMPASPKLEGAPGAAWDRHLLVVDSFTCTSHEFLQTSWIPVINRWKAEKAVTMDLNGNAPRRGGSATASGYSMLATMIRYDEVAAGRVDHAIGISVPTIANRAPVWPAFGTDGNSNDPNAPAMGTWLRLRSDVDLSRLGRDAQVIARALQQHGAIFADTGPAKIALGAENSDSTWEIR